MSSQSTNPLPTKQQLIIMAQQLFREEQYFYAKRQHLFEMIIASGFFNVNADSQLFDIYGVVLGMQQPVQQEAEDFASLFGSPPAVVDEPVSPAQPTQPLAMISYGAPTTLRANQPPAPATPQPMPMPTQPTPLHSRWQQVVKRWSRAPALVVSQQAVQEPLVVDENASSVAIAKVMLQVEGRQCQLENDKWRVLFSFAFRYRAEHPEVRYSGNVRKAISGAWAQLAAENPETKYLEEKMKKYGYTAARLVQLICLLGVPAMAALRAKKIAWDKYVSYQKVRTDEWSKFTGYLTVNQADAATEILRGAQGRVSE